MRIKAIVPFTLPDGKSMKPGQVADIADVDAKLLVKIKFATASVQSAPQPLQQVEHRDFGVEA